MAGVRGLKAPLIFLGSTFSKRPERVMALAGRELRKAVEGDL